MNLKEAERAKELADLKASAEEVAQRKGHELGQWGDGPPGKQRATCTQCDMYAAVDRNAFGQALREWCKPRPRVAHWPT